jgi:hypothetical protein
VTQREWDQQKPTLALLQCSSCFGQTACRSVPCACAQSLMDLNKAAIARHDAQVKALEFYAGEARALARYMAAGKDQHAEAIIASVTVLSLDAGRRADAALSVIQNNSKSEV